MRAISTAAEMPEPPDLIVCDASFIGLETVLPAALALAAPGARLVALIKPQFEVGPRRASARAAWCAIPRSIAKSATASPPGSGAQPGWHGRGRDREPDPRPARAISNS